MLSAKRRGSGRSSQLGIKTGILEALTTLVGRPKKDCEHLSLSAAGGYICLSTRLRMPCFDTSLWLPSLYDSQAVGLFARFLLRMLTVSGVPLEYGKAFGRQQEHLAPDTSAKADPDLGSSRQKKTLPNSPPESIAPDANNSLRPETGTIIVRGFSRDCIISCSMRPHSQLATTAILHAKRTTRDGDGGDGACLLESLFWGIKEVC